MGRVYASKVYLSIEKAFPEVEGSCAETSSGPRGNTFIRYIIQIPPPNVNKKTVLHANRKSQAKNAVLFQQTILRYFVHFVQREKATRQSPAGSLCFIVLFPCYFRVLCVRFSLKYERTGAARPPPPSTRPAPCSHSARLKPSLGSCSSRFGFA